MSYKKTCVLQKSTDTASHGDVVESWHDVVKFTAAVRALNAHERLMDDKQTVYASHRMYTNASAIGMANVSELTEKNRVRIGADIYEIKAVVNNRRRYEVELLRIE